MLPPIKIYRTAILSIEAEKEGAATGRWEKTDKVLDLIAEEIAEAQM